MTRPPVAAALTLSLATALVLVSPDPAAAQTTVRPPAQTRPRTPKWEVSFRGGFALGGSAPDAAPALPPAGQSFLMADGLTPTRAVSSWFLGDGAALLNQVLLLRGAGVRMDALESAWPMASRRPGPQVGGSLARHVRGGLWLEFSADVGLDPLGFGGDASDDIEAARANYEHALTALAGTATSVIANANITASSDITSGGRRLLTSAVVYYRSTAPRIRPYLLAGIGFASALGGDTAARLTGVNRYTTPGQVTIEETDAIAIKYKQTNGSFWILGGGMERDLSRLTAFRVEARLLLGTLKYTGYLDTAPSVASTTPGGAIVLNGTNPGIQFSSIAGLQPSLSGAARTDFQVQTAEKSAMQWVVSAAYIRRF
ncbi:MAG TPA: hypothetical protein VFV78_04300 [Vicinamibacterales bacterium]|nr:hypothetical protein [Vicinamibacterales bacterium]